MAHLEGYKLSYEQEIYQNKKMASRLKHLRSYNSALNSKFLNSEEILNNTKKQNGELIDIVLQLKEACSVVVECEVSHIIHEVCHLKTLVLNQVNQYQCH